MTTELPYRPRLARHALLRRHLIDGCEKTLLHDELRSEVIELEPGQLELLAACDGTRDFGGLLLAASRAQVYRRASDAARLLRALAARGLLEDGLELPGSTVETPSRRLEPLPGFGLRCSMSGACCRSFSSIAFTRSEATRALGLVPEALGADPRVMLPLHGSGSREVLAVTLVDGRCAFLGDEGACRDQCRVHARGGAEAKPLGCRLFPRSFVDDGEAVRISVRVECPCVLESLDADGGSELLPDGALAPGTAVAALPETIAVARGRGEPRAALRRWSEALCAALGERIDGAAAFWALAGAVEEHGLAPAASLAALDGEPPEPVALAAHLQALRRRTEARALSAAAWRAPSDRTRRLAAWLDEAARALGDATAFVARRESRDESFYLRAIVHGHQLVEGSRPLAAALRDRAVRVLLARAAALAGGCEDDPSAERPLTAVETMMRAQGLGGYDEETASG